MGYTPSWILELIIGDGNEYLLGQYPNINFDLASILSNIVLKTWNASNDLWGSQDPSDGFPNGEEPSIPFGNSLIIFAIIGTITIIQGFKKRRKVVS